MNNPITTAVKRIRGVNQRIARAFVAISLLGLVIAIALIGRVGVVEFSPSTLRYRTANYYVLPFTSVQVTPRFDVAMRESVLADHLHEIGVVASPSELTDWQFAAGRRWDLRGWEGGVGHAYSHCFNGHEEQWLQWSRRADRAQFWHAVHDAVMANDVQGLRELVWSRRDEVLGSAR